MIHRICDDIDAVYYNMDEAIPSSNNESASHSHASHIFVDSASDDVERINELASKGFVFHDRTILTVIDTRRLPENLNRYVRYEVSEQGQIPDNVTDIALTAYPTDRRFHLGLSYNQNKAEKIIRAYIDELASDKGLNVFLCKHNDKLIGYSILKELSEGIYENLLGAVVHEYQSRGAAFSLYAGLLLSMRDKGYKEYRGWISTKNVASLNLHVALGGKFSMTKDRYVRRFVICTSECE